MEKLPPARFSPSSTTMPSPAFLEEKVLPWLHFQVLCLDGAQSAQWLTQWDWLREGDLSFKGKPLRGPQHLHIACLLLRMPCAWPCFPLRHGATLVFSAGVVDFLSVCVHIYPLLFLQMVPSNPFWSIHLSIPRSDARAQKIKKTSSLHFPLFSQR